MKKTAVYFFLVLLFTASTFFAQQDSLSNEGPRGMTMEQFNKLINTGTKPILVYFTADWCVVCKREKPVLVEVKKETGTAVDYLTLDMEHNPLIAEHFEVDSLPSFILYKDGHLIWNSVGFQDKEMLMKQLRVFLKR